MQLSRLTEKEHILSLEYIWEFLCDEEIQLGYMRHDDKVQLKRQYPTDKERAAYIYHRVLGELQV